MKFVLGALGFLKGLPRWVYLSVAGIAALGLLWALHGHWEREAHDAAYNEGWTAQKVLTDREIAKNGINLASIDRLQAVIVADNAEKDARAKAYADAKAADARTVADMNKRYAGTAGRVSQLEAISRVPGGNAACRVPGAVTDALSGL